MDCDEHTPKPQGGARSSLALGWYERRRWRQDRAAFACGPRRVLLRTRLDFQQIVFGTVYALKSSV
jgi:hypothetical protein